MPEISVNGLSLYYEERGEGPAIVCIHGAGGTSAMWAQAADVLAESGRVITYDRRGCARSELPESYLSTTVEQQADDAAALIEALAAAPALVIGRSYGGAVAIDLALRYRELVRALVLLEGEALGLSPAGREWTRRIRDRLHEIAAREGIDAVFEAMIEEVVGPGAWASFPNELRETLTGNGTALLAELQYADHEMPDADAFARIDLPTLLVAATASPPEQREMTEAMAAALPNARMEVEPGGHLIDPAAPAVLSFVKEMLG